MLYNSINIDTFAKQFKELLCNRVDKFVGELKNKLTTDGTKIRSYQEWVAEYQKWIVKSQIKKMCEKYVGE